MKTVISEANPDHIDTIVSFQLKMAKETENIDLNSSVLRNGVSRIFEDKTLGKYFIAESDNTVVGALLITYEWSDWRNKMMYWIQSVYVSPEYRKHGVFSNLYNHIKNLVLQDDQVFGIRLYVDKSNINAINVYKHMGMDGAHYQTFEWMKH